MAQRTIASMGTGAVTDTNQVEFSVRASHFRGNVTPIISVAGLAGGETASLWKKMGTEWGEVADSSGVQIDFTATAPAYEINGPGVFGLTKTASAGALTVYLDDGI